MNSKAVLRADNLYDAAMPFGGYKVGRRSAYGFSCSCACVPKACSTGTVILCHTSWLEDTTRGL